MVNWQSVRKELLTVPERLSTELELMIVRGELQPGQRLPPERQLAEELGVSRASLRESLHELSFKGLIQRKPGLGTTVTDPGRSAVERRSVLDPAQRAFKEVMTLRTVVEPRVAALAADTASSRQVADLRDLCEQAGRARAPGRYLELDRQFHLAIAESTGNSLVVELLRTVNEWAEPSRRLGLQGTGRQTLSTAAHEQIVKAIAAGDAQAAERAMDLHLEQIFEHVNEGLDSTARTHR